MHLVTLKFAVLLTGWLILLVPAAFGQVRVPAAFSWSNDATIGGISTPMIAAAPSSATVEVETAQHLLLAPHGAHQFFNCTLAAPNGARI
jgi:hypothetical protein